MRTALLAVVLFVSSLLAAHAQSADDRPAVTRTLAFENATVIRAPGTQQTGVTVVVRDGMIRAVGADADIPYDARVIEADSLYIYAGFIDGLSQAGIDMPDPDDDDESTDDPSLARSGVQPDRHALTFFDPTASRVEQLRAQGFTTAHIVPDGRMLPGQGALVALQGSDANAALIQDGVSQFAQFRGARGSWPNVVAPSTTMGVIAMMRQVMREADRRQQLEAAYARNPQGSARPPRDAAHTALMPAVSGEQPLMLAASSALDVHRALDLQQELGFSLMLANLKTGFEAVDALQTADVPLFLSLELPERTELPSDTTDAERPAPDPVFQVGPGLELDRERTNLMRRLRAEQERYIGQAATLHEAGLTFGLTTHDVSPGDIHDRLRTLRDSGVPQETLLAALTTVPAAAFGVDRQLGQVAPGFMGNLVVTDAPLFEEDTSIRHVVVDGYLYTQDAAPEGEVTGDAEAVVGDWTMTLETPQGEVEIEVTLSGDAGGLSGTAVGPDGSEQQLESISFDGETLSFVVPGSQMGDTRVSGTVEDDRFDGSLSAGGMSFDITGQRTSPER
jgi:imidazolonepropionase-like amidohydrolase